MDSQHLIKMIYQTKEWYESKIAQLELISKADESVKFEAVAQNGEKIELPEKHMHGFKLGIAIAIETMGKFPINITDPDDDDY